MEATMVERSIGNDRLVGRGVFITLEAAYPGYKPPYDDCDYDQWSVIAARMVELTETIFIPNRWLAITLGADCATPAEVVWFVETHARAYPSHKLSPRVINRLTK